MLTRVISILCLGVILLWASCGFAQDHQHYQVLLNEARYEDVLDQIKADRARGQDNAELGVYAAKAYDKIIRRSGPLKRLSLTKKLRAELNHVLEMQPGHVYALEELADFYHYAPAIGGGSEKKSEIFALRLKAANIVRYHIMKGRHAHDADDLAGAIGHFEKAKSLAPDNAEVRAGLGNVLVFDQQFTSAFVLFDGLITEGNARVDIYYQAARAAQLGKMETAKAYAYLHHYIKHAKPATRFSKAAGHYRLGHLYKADSKANEARAEFEQALAFNPKLKQAKTALKELNNE